MFSAGFSEFDALVLRCFDARARSYIAEAVTCLMEGAFRASIVVTWVVVVHGLLKYGTLVAAALPKGALGSRASTGLAVPEFLRASHIKPWAECERDAERFDVYIGLLLAPHLDAAFDCGFITMADDGTVIVGGALDEGARSSLGVDEPLCVREFFEGHRSYLSWHRERVFNCDRGEQ